MLTVAQRFLGFALLVLAVAIVVVIASITPSFQECKASPPTEKSQSAKTQTLHLAESIVGRETAVNIECVVISLDENNGLITALATAFLAYITYRLVVGGEKTTRKVNRAYFVGGGQIKIIDGKRYFQVEVGNHGQTPARLYEYAVHFATLDEVCREHRPFQPSTFVDQYPPGEKHTLRATRGTSASLLGVIVFLYGSRTVTDGRTGTIYA
jgi:hypothetical protein